ncbi:hypothetical protein U1Q18_014740 [Sarracenia purpurea var. burkii]
MADSLASLANVAASVSTSSTKKRILIFRDEIPSIVNDSRKLFSVSGEISDENGFSDDYSNILSHDAAFGLKDTSQVESNENWTDTSQVESNENWTNNMALTL